MEEVSGNFFDQEVVVVQSVCELNILPHGRFIVAFEYVFLIIVWFLFILWSLLWMSFYLDL